MKKLFLGSLIVVFVFMFALTLNVAFAASANDTFSTVNVTVDSTISIACAASVNMGTITGTGSASNDGACTVITNNTGGYSLAWAASAAAMTGSNGDTIAAYGPAVADTPETWSIAASASEWGARLKSSSTVSAAEWGTDSSSEKFLNVATGGRTIATSSSNPTTGDTETLTFKSQVGSTRVQESGLYTVDVTMTATTL